MANINENPKMDRVEFSLLGIGGQYEKITLDSEMNCDFPNANLEGKERYREVDLVPSSFSEFLIEHASFRRISDDIYLIGNRGTGIFDEKGFIKEKSELRPEFAGHLRNKDEIEPYGNFVCILKVENTEELEILKEQEQEEKEASKVKKTDLSKKPENERNWV